MATQVDICNLALRRIGQSEISAIDESTKNAQYCNAFWTYVLDEVLEDYSWNFAKKVRTLDYARYFKVYDGDDDYTITGITQADPAVVSVTSHPFETGQTVYIDDVVGMTELNGRVFEISDTGANTFELVDIDSSPMTAYTSGGICYRKEVDPKYDDGYTYDLPADYLRALHLNDKTSEFEVLGTGNNRRLCTIVEDAVLHYETLESTTTNMLNRFISAMAFRLAAELAIPLVGKKDPPTQLMMDQYYITLGKKSVIDAKTHKKDIDDSEPWLDDADFEI